MSTAKEPSGEARVPKVVALTRYAAKGMPGEQLPAMALVEGLGVEGDIHQGGERQISILAAEARRWMGEQQEHGLCFGRFRENLLVEGLAWDALETGARLSVGEALLRVSAQSKHCFADCGLYMESGPCRLTASAAFATVERGGTVRAGDSVLILPLHFR